MSRADRSSLGCTVKLRVLFWNAVTGRREESSIEMGVFFSWIELLRSVGLHAVESRKLNLGSQGQRVRDAESQSTR